MKKMITGLLLLASLNVWAKPGQYQINQACLSVGCFAGDNPATDTVEITQSAGTFILTSNLTVDSNGAPAILVDNSLGASSVVIDLNGFRIHHSGIADTNTHGIQVLGQNSMVTIKNGQISAFQDGVQALEGAGLLVQNMTFRINRDDGISLTRGRIENSVFHANEYGVFAVTGPGGAGLEELSKKVMLVANLFSDVTVDQRSTAGFSSDGYCKDNVVTIQDPNQFGQCTLVGENRCDGALCSVNRSHFKTEE